jgi:hypothetical protein
MDINSWLTIITVLIAILAFFPKEERVLLQMKLPKMESFFIFVILFIVIPYLIYFPQFLARFPFLKTFTVPNGLAPANIAFGLFYVIFFWMMVTLLWRRPRIRSNAKIITYFEAILVEQPFAIFFSLFRKYSPEKLNEKNWFLYRNLILHPVFLEGISKLQPAYLLNHWQNLEGENELKQVLLPFLSNPKSAYYTEIKAHEGVSSLLKSSPLLQTILVTNLDSNLKNRLLPIMSDFVKSRIRLERGKGQSIYNAPHEFVHIRADEGYDLPIYYHLRFIHLLYATAITNKVEVSGNMYSLFEGFIREMLQNMDPSKDEGEYPSNYHWLISEMFRSIDEWLEDFGGEHMAQEDADYAETKYTCYNPNSVYVDFIPSFFNFSIQALYEGLEKGKVVVSFIARQYHYYMFSYYFSHYATEELKKSIEENVIQKIPENILEEVIDFTLDERFASNYHTLSQAYFRGSATDKQMQQRLHSVLFS